MRRRDFLRDSMSLSLAAASLPLANGVAMAAGVGRQPDVWLRLRALRKHRQVLPGATTAVWTYAARLIEGDDDVLSPATGSYLGPTIRVRRGQRVRIDFANLLPQESIVHWHGLHVPAAMDGHPRFAVPRGGRYRYEFDVVNRAGTYWYHPHPHGNTGEQVYRGLAGLFVVTDDEEQSLGLPSGEEELSLVIQDRRFDSNNQLIYHSGPAAGGPHGQGFLGNRILVNGVHEPTLDVRAQPYRLRLLNGSNSRIYKLGWSDGTPLSVIATDGGLLRKPARRPFVTLAPAERVELWADFSAWPVGTPLQLRTLAFEHGMGGMGMGDDVDMPMGSAANILNLRVVAGAGAGSLPSRLSRFPRYRERNAVNAGTPREFVFAGSFGTWTINNRTFEMEAVAEDEKVGLGTLEAWDFVNSGAGGPGTGAMMRMPHPVHAHGQQFQVIHRDVAPGFASAWGTVADGYVDGGWKDTVLLMPGERVRVLKRFDDYTGLFLLHCHNLEHEDAGMMRNFLVDD